MHQRANGLRIGFAFNLKPTDDVRASVLYESLRELPTTTNPSDTNGSEAAMGGHVDFSDNYAEWDDAETIDAIEAALSQIGEVVRLEADSQFPAKLSAAQPDIVFNFAEGMGGASREGHIPAFCEFWGIPYTGSDPLTMGICLDKARARGLGPCSPHHVPSSSLVVAQSQREGTTTT